jgi:adenylate kinase
MNKRTRTPRELIKGVVTVTITGAQGAGKTVLTEALHDFLLDFCKFAPEEVVVRKELPSQARLRDRLRQVSEERQAKIILVDVDPR